MYANTMIRYDLIELQKSVLIRPVFIKSLKHLNSLYISYQGYIILIVGAALVISGIVISALWAAPFAGKILRESTILSGASIRPGGSVNASTQVIDTSRPVSLAIHVERNNATAAEGQIPNNSLRETVQNPNGIVMTNNNFTRGFFSTIKPDIAGKYTVL
jgi:hypothetical protein